MSRRGRADRVPFVLRPVASFVSGRRTKWVVLGVWIVAFAVMMPLGAKLADETKDDTDVVPARERRVDRGRQDPRRGLPRAARRRQGLIVYQRDGGLTEADKQKIADDAQALEALPDDELPLTAPPAVPFAPGSPPELVSPDGDARLHGAHGPDRLRQRRRTGARTSATSPATRADGMRILLTGDLGFSTDAEEVFGELDTKLLLATVLLVLVLLGAIYRAVLVALTPLIVVFFAYTVADGVRLPVREVRRDRVLERDHDPDRADVRRRDRLLPAAGLAIPRGAAPDRGQARGDGARPAQDRARRSSPAA